MQMTKIEDRPRPERRMVSMKDVTEDGGLRFRHRAADRGHVRELVQALRRGEELPPVALWADHEDRLVLVDGLHRLLAYKTARRAKVPVVVHRGTRAEMAEMALMLNAKAVLPLTPLERADAAWRLVCEFGAELTGDRIAKAAGISRRTVQTMRKRWKDMEAAEISATGSWWRDRMNRPQTAGDFDHEAAEAQRQEMLGKIAEGLRKAAGMAPKTDTDLLGEALMMAFGHRALSAAVEYVLGQAHDSGEEEDGEGSSHWREPVETMLTEPDF